MAREGKIQHYTDIVAAVFRAEHALKKQQPEWSDRLLNYKQNGEDAVELMNEYCRAVATELLDHYTEDNA